MTNVIRSTVGALAVGMLMAACTTSSPPPTAADANASINNAAQAVNRAAADPHVAKYAPGELQRARDSLKQAQAIWNDKGDTETASHLAYLAHQQAATATELAKRRVAEDTVKVASAERDRLVASIPKSDQQLRQELAGLPAKADERGITVMLPRQGFIFDQSQLPAGTMPAINRLASVLKRHPERKVVIEGHTDNEGNKAYNKDLGKERADAMRAALIKRGVAANRIVVRSYGEDSPIASNDTSAGRRENRRADIVILDARGRMTEHSSSSGQTSSGR